MKLIKLMKYYCSSSRSNRIQGTQDDPVCLPGSCWVLFVWWPEPLETCDVLPPTHPSLLIFLLPFSLTSFLLLVLWRHSYFFHLSSLVEVEFQGSSHLSQTQSYPSSCEGSASSTQHISLLFSPTVFSWSALVR